MSRSQFLGQILAEEPTLVRGFESLAILALTLATYGGFAPEHCRTGMDEFRSFVQVDHPGCVLKRSYKACYRAEREPLSPARTLPTAALRPRKSARRIRARALGQPAKLDPDVERSRSRPVRGPTISVPDVRLLGGGPITHAAYLLRRELRTLRDRLDPDRSDPAWDRMVLIGHSMGGILCKMMAQRSGSKLWDLTSDRPFEKLAGPTDARELLHGELVYEPVTEVRRVIFIATPHRGSRLVCRAIKEIETCVVPKPEPLQRALARLLACNGPDAFTPTFRAGLPTSLDQLAWEHPLLLAIDSLPIDQVVKRHSIIADQRLASPSGWRRRLRGICQRTPA